MSADNGIYILITDGPEYRVRYLTSVDNYAWDDEKQAYTNDPDVMIRNARELWEDCEVFKTFDEAFKLAVELLAADTADGYIVEYGISNIKIPRKF